MKSATVEAALQLIGHAIALKLHVQLDQPREAQRDLARARHVLALLDDALTPKPPAAPAAGPR